MKTKLNIFSGLVLVMTLSTCTFPTVSKAQATEDYTKYVNPFLGTALLLSPDIIGYTPPKGHSLI